MNKASSEEQQALLDAIVEAFREPVAPVRVSWAYCAGLVLVTAAMALLPVIYVGLILLVAGLTVYHAVHNFTLFEGGRDVRLHLLMYCAPLFGGCAVAVTMLKPLAARRPKTKFAYILQPTDEPLLFTLVALLCKAIHAPFPEVIEVDLNVNAAARFRRGCLSFFGNDLVLTIGLPLAAGLRQCQLAGIIAHELGHFSQSLAMRLMFVITGITGWFARAVYQRDAWDRQLRESAGAGGLWGVMFLFALLLVYLGRGILWIFLQIAICLSFYLCRQMEYHADRWEARIAGSDTFADSMYRLTLLGLSCNGLLTQLATTGERELPHHFSEHVVAAAKAMPDDVKRTIANAITSDKTGLLDTHPSNRDRIAAAQKRYEPGLYRSQGPATSLFTNFHALSRKVTTILQNRA